jgi:putative heme-binding domain-containing protein
MPAFLLSLVTGSLLAIACATPLAAAEPFELREGDSIAIVGNALPERMQHDGYLETLLQRRFAGKNVRVRNLGFNADEVTIRQRSEGFGSPEEWLDRVDASVVFAFFGFNESFAGEAGVAKFESDLTNWVRATKAAKFDDKANPRIVLFSPIAVEDLQRPALSDGSESNARLPLYVAAIERVAKQENVGFVDLFLPSKAFYDREAEPLTINGIHLNSLGNRRVAEAIDVALFGPPAEAVRWEALEPLRAAVLDKNFHWFHRYRTTDGYSSYGGRSYLKFVDDQTNREVMFRELEILDQMTAERDKRIWATAEGESYQVDDSNTSPFIPVKTNKPGPGPDGEHAFLSGEEAISKMTIGEGLKVELFADEGQFEELIQPVQMAFDTKGRLFVAVWPSYPHWKPKDEMNDKLLILADENGDGKADSCKTFADGLHNPTGFEFWNGGVLIAQAPDLMFLKDTDGDDVADLRMRLLGGLDSADTHHTANSFLVGPDGALYFQEGVFHRTQIETPSGPVRNADACVWRFDPQTYEVIRYANYPFANPHGHAIDRWGQDIIHDGTGAQPYQGGVISGHLEGTAKHNTAPQVYSQRTRPCPGTETLSSQHFPEEFQQNLLVGNVIGFQGLLRYKIEVEGSALKGTELEPIVSSSDPNFRPSDFETGPDGALYFTDWQNPIIGHMQHNLRDPSRDHAHGRVYRVTYEGRPLSQPPAIDGEPIEKLVALLAHPEDRVRLRTRVELSERDPAEVLTAAHDWLGEQDKNAPEFAHKLLEALWLHQQRHVFDADLLNRALTSNEPLARASATRVLSYWVDEYPEAPGSAGELALDRLRELALDEDGLVRLEAVRAATYVDRPEAIEVVVLAQTKPVDATLKYVMEEALRTLEPRFERALAAGEKVALTTAAGQSFALKRLPLDQILTLERSPAVLEELLFRPGVRDEIRQEALADVAERMNQSVVAASLEAIGRLDSQQQLDRTVLTDLVNLTVSRPPGELAPSREAFEALALEAKQPVVRQTAMAALIEIDRSTDATLKLASGSVRALRDLVAAAPFVDDLDLRLSLYDEFVGLLTELPPGLQQADAGGGAGLARYIRIELPRKGTLTLAEVEAIASGRNAAPSGRATQSSTSHSGEAKRAIDGNTSSIFGAGGQTHSQENEDHPWWELDLGSEQPVETIVVWNRQEGFQDRLKGFTLRVLDGNRQEIFRQADIPAPDRKAEYALSLAAPQAVIRQAVIETLPSIRGKESETFTLLAPYLAQQETRAATVRALQRIPRQSWNGALAPELLASLVGGLKSISPEERTLQAALDEMELADNLAATLPEAEARKVRSELRELGVRVLRIGTLPERMSYDKELLAVAAGRPVVILFENVDLMPHNFVLTQPGALEEVGLLAEATAQSPDAIERQYVPPSDKVILGSDLLQTRQSQRIAMDAPKQPGVYPYVCTYPGHWRRMYGALYVVADLDAYLADPEAYAAANELPIRDDLLKDRRPRTEWKLADLIDDARQISAPRSHANGRAMFKVASCVGCHVMEGQGAAIGPDLTKLEPPYKSEDLLEHILEPSKKVDEKWRSYAFVTDEGRVLTGMIVKETADAYEIVENPLADAKPKALPKANVDQKRDSPVSLMPKGALDPLTREEVVDLLAYLLAKGNANDPLYDGSAK